MIDPVQLVIDWLLTPSMAMDGIPVTNQVPIVLQNRFTSGGAAPNNTANRVYGGHLIPGFDPAFGPGLVVRVGAGTESGTGGGTSHPELPIDYPRIQLTAWADKNQYDIARELYGAAFDWMQRRNNVDLGASGFIMSSLEQVHGQDVDDPHTGQATIIGFWKIVIRY